MSNKNGKTKNDIHPEKEDWGKPYFIFLYNVPHNVYIWGKTHFYPLFGNPYVKDTGYPYYKGKEAWIAAHEYFEKELKNSGTIMASGVIVKEDVPFEVK